MLTKNKDNHNVWLEHSPCEGEGHTSETSRRLVGHLTRMWSFEKPECEPLREPWSLRMFSRTFSVMMEVSLWSITSRPLFDKNNKADHCVEFHGCVWKEEPPALQQSSVEPMPSLHFRPYKLWTECQLHKVASSFKDQNLSWFFRRYCSSEVCFLWAPAWALTLLGFLCVSLRVPGPAVLKGQRSTAVWIGPGGALMEETRNLGSRVWAAKIPVLPEGSTFSKLSSGLEGSSLCVKHSLIFLFCLNS